MKMNVFEYTVIAKGEEIAGFDNLDYATTYARQIATDCHCDVDIVNAFTGEVHLHLEVYVHITYNADFEELNKIYTIKEGWAA